MQIIRVIFLILILIAPMAVASVIYLDDDKETCEVLETLDGEEEDEKEVERIEGINFFHAVFCEFNHDDNDTHDLLSAYIKDNPFIFSIIQEVQTPPPKYTIC